MSKKVSDIIPAKYRFYVCVCDDNYDCIGIANTEEEANKAYNRLKQDYKCTVFTVKSEFIKL